MFSRFSKAALVVALLFNLTQFASAEDPYGSSFNFGPGIATQFKDFTLTFKSVRANVFYPGTSRRLAPIFDFRVKTESAEKIVSWSKGTGDIGPVFFSATKTCFQFDIDKVQTDGSGSGKIQPASVESCRGSD